MDSFLIEPGAVLSADMLTQSPQKPWKVVSAWSPALLVST